MKKVIITFILTQLSHLAVAQSNNREFIEILNALTSDYNFRERSFSSKSKINREYLYIHYSTALRLYDDSLDPNSYFPEFGPFRRKIFSDSNRFVFVVNNISFSDTVNYFLVFDEIDISDNKASIEAHTSSVTQVEEFINKYYRAKLHLKKRRGVWILTKKADHVNQML